MIHRLLQTPSDLSFFTEKLQFGMQIRHFSVNSSCHKYVHRFFKTHPSFFQNNVHEKILILTTFYGTKTIGEVKWKVDNASHSADTKQFDAIHRQLDV